jgi:hypothetical protein
MAPFAISTRYVAVVNDGRTYALDFFQLHWNIAWRDDDEPKRHSKLAKSPPPSCRRQSRLARASFSGPAIKVPFAGPSSDARRGGARFWAAGRADQNRGGCGRRCPGTGGTLYGRVSFVLAGTVGAEGLAGPAGLRQFDAPPGQWRPGTEGPWAFQRGQRGAELLAGPAAGSGFFQRFGKDLEDRIICYSIPRRRSDSGRERDEGERLMRPTATADGLKNFDSLCVFYGPVLWPMPGSRGEVE